MNSEPGPASGIDRGNVFRGTAPSLPCCEITGADCSRPFPLNADTCGIEGHVPIYDITKSNYEPRAILQGARYRPTLTVNEDYDFADDIVDPERDRALPNLDPDTFDADAIWVSKTSQRMFTAHHGADAQRALDELRFFASEALRRGRYTRTPRGFHRLEFQSIAVHINPDATALTRYETRHYERTPRQVLEGVRSRFKHGGRAPLTAGEEEARRSFLLALRVGAAYDVAVSGVVNFGLFVSVDGHDGLLHISNLPEGTKPADYAEVGDRLRVKVLSVDVDQGRFAVALA